MPPVLIARFYPRATDPRPPLHSADTRTHRIRFFRAAALNFCLLLLLFLGLYAYLFGALYQAETRAHHLRIVWVDYDGGGIGAAVREAYRQLRSDAFPTLVEQSAAQFPAPTDLIAAVCRTDYWAALVVHAGASATFESAVTGVNTAAYDRANVLSYVWNEVRYPTVVDGLIASNLQNLTQRARGAYVRRHGMTLVPQIPSDADAIAAFTDPWTLTAINLQAATQGTRAVYNTLAIVLMIIQDFFFLGTINGLYEQFQIYTRVRPLRILLFRFGVSAGFAMLATMLASGMIWAFRASWNATPPQWALTWLVLWLFAHQNFLTLDVFTIWLPPAFVSMALITWVVMNVTSIIYPFELSPAFYRWSYALPAHAAYDALTDVWSHGCNPHLHYSLPVLFAYELSSMTLSGIGTYKRCHYAMIRRDAAAVTWARKSPDSEGGSPHKTIQTGADGENETAQRTTDQDQPNERAHGPDPSEATAKETATHRKPHKHHPGSHPMQFGPSFHLIGPTDDEGAQE